MTPEIITILVLVLWVSSIVYSVIKLEHAYIKAYGTNKADEIDILICLIPIINMFYARGATK